MAGLTQSVHAVREFNRFYTRTVGLLNETLVESGFSLTEARVLFELGHRHLPSAVEIAEILLLDAAYLTRILRRFREAGLLTMHADPADGRRRILELTDHGREALAGLQARQEEQLTELLSGLGAGQLATLRNAMTLIRETLGQGPVTASATLRAHRPGDIGWVIERQASLYANEYGWSIEFEVLVAGIGASFLSGFKPGRDFCWIAERHGERLGAIFLVSQNEDEAKLRLLHVEQAARGQGIGRMLVDRCVDQARQCGYRRLVLWTNDVLTDARRLYERAGFTLEREERHHSFGKDLVGQYWQLDL